MSNQFYYSRAMAFGEPVRGLWLVAEYQHPIDNVVARTPSEAEAQTLVHMLNSLTPEQVAAAKGAPQEEAA